MVGCEVKAEGCLEIDGAAGAADADSYVLGAGVLWNDDTRYKR